MKTITVSIPDNIEKAARSYINAGFFKSESDLLMTATVDFMHRNRIELIEKFALEDIEWAKREAKKKK